MYRDDYYQILGVSSEASQAQLKEAYRALARTLHPDVNHEPNANVVFAQITEAYSVLSKPEARADYDKWRQYRQTESSTPSYPSTTTDAPSNPFSVLFPNLQPIEHAPGMGSFNGIGVRAYGSYNYDRLTGSYETILYFTFFWIPLLTLGRYRVVNLGSTGCFPFSFSTRYIFLGRVPIQSRDWLAPAISLPIVALLLFSSSQQPPSNQYYAPSYAPSANSNHSPSVTRVGPQSSYLYPPFESQRISQLRSDIQEGQEALIELETELNLMQDSLDNSENQLNDLDYQINIIENRSRSGGYVNQTEYERMVSEYNEIVVIYNQQLEEGQNLALEYEELLESVNRNIDLYNQLIE